jgi:heme/copper-type cytochrome/quinol oxidase subunit 2
MESRLRGEALCLLGKINRRTVIVNGRFPLIRRGHIAAAIVALLALVPAAFGQPDHQFKWRDWWLPDNYSEHGGAMDDLFIVIFWITTIALVIVQVLMVYFLIKYRHSANRAKAHFIHGNTRVEMVWTLAPAVILAALALASKGVWHDYRYNEKEKEPRTQLMVIGEQFKWNVIYSGPDGKVGKYLLFPKVSDAKYRNLENGAARRRINNYIADENPLGRLETDPDGEDDDWDKTPGRAVIIPYDKPIDIVLGSKDVLHDFFLPNFRVKLDAVPGMLGHIYFRAKKQSTEDTPIDNVPLAARLWIDRDTLGAKGADGVFMLADPKNEASTVGTHQTLGRLASARLEASGVASPTPQQIEEAGKALKTDLKAAGVTSLSTYVPFEIVCEELCGSGHATMRGEMIVVSPRQYMNMIHKNNPPTTQPVPSIAATESK